MEGVTKPVFFTIYVWVSMFVFVYACVCVCVCVYCKYSQNENSKWPTRIDGFFHSFKISIAQLIFSQHYQPKK